MQRDIFQPPDDLTKLRQGMEAIDRQMETERYPRRPLRFAYGGLAAAALIGLAAGLYYYVQPDVAATNPITRISLQVPLTRGGADDEFRIGDRVWLMVDALRPAHAYVALLDSKGELAPIDGSQVHLLKVGENRLPLGETPYLLGGIPGTESFLVLVSEAGLDASSFRSIIATAASQLTRNEKSHEQLVADVLAALRRESRISAQAYTYQLMPTPP
jgi:hypothetical protein